MGEIFEIVGKAVEKKENPNADKLVIMGFSPTSRHHALKFIEKYPGCEVWCMNEFYLFANEFPMQKATRWFEIHNCRNNENVMPDHPQGKKHREYLKAFPGKLYIQNKEKWWSDFENAIEFPAKEIVNFFPRKYFSSTPSWHFAFALMEGLKHMKETGKFKWTKILAAGIDMQSGWNKKTDVDPITGKIETKDVVSNEYALQRPSCEWLVGFFDMLKLMGHDCEFIIPEESTMFKFNRLYGFEEYFQQEEVMSMKKALEVQLSFYNSQIAGLKNEYQNVQTQATTHMDQLRQKLAGMEGGKQAVELRLADF